MTLNEILNKYGRKVEDIKEIYNGRNHYCRCGCGGVYYEAGSPEMKMAIDEMNKDTFTPSDYIEADDNLINIPYDNDNDLCYCIYFH